MITYERITTVDYTGKRVTRIIMNPSESKMFITGKRVNSQGDWIEMIDVMDKTCITKRVPLRMNPHYGEFEVVV